VVGAVGLGYVGLPLALTAVTAGFKVIGFDVDSSRADQINRGESFIKHIDSFAISEAVLIGRLLATSNFDHLSQVDVILICSNSTQSPSRTKSKLR
jgi:UDP-N-acetyl-D-glucosamine dehydrogenase